MRSKELIFGVAAVACVALAADASAQENQRHAGKTMGTSAGATHAAHGAIQANQQAGIRANGGNRNFAAEERTTRTRGYARDRDRETRGFNENRTSVDRDRLAETRRHSLPRPATLSPRREIHERFLV
jgi:hypothetical protein